MKKVVSHSSYQTLIPRHVNFILSDTVDVEQYSERWSRGYKTEVRKPKKTLTEKRESFFFNMIKSFVRSFFSRVELDGGPCPEGEKKMDQDTWIVSTNISLRTEWWIWPLLESGCGYNLHFAWELLDIKKEKEISHSGFLTISDHTTLFSFLHFISLLPLLSSE